MDRLQMGRRIAAFRKARGMSMRELGRLAGLSQGQVSRIESGRQGLRSETLFRIAKALRVEPYRFFLPEERDPSGGERAGEGLPAATPQGSREPRPRGSGAGRDVPVSERLRDALRSPEFVALLERVANARKGSPEEYKSYRELIRLINERERSRGS
jgi:transcriptional regulator with XRE-family HTH domain